MDCRFYMSLRQTYHFNNFYTVMSNLALIVGIGLYRVMLAIVWVVNERLNTYLHSENSSNNVKCCSKVIIFLVPTC